MERWFPKDKIVITGNPVRNLVAKIEGKKELAAEYFGLSASKPTLLVIGGSLGALTLNESIASNLEKLADSGFQLIWQPGKNYAVQAQEATERIGKMGLKTTAFIDRMDYAYALADVVISRAGALSVSELCIAAKPTIFVPSPNVAEDHQTRNAQALVDSNAAILIADSEARSVLVPRALELLKDTHRRAELSERIASMAEQNADERIALEVLKLVTNN